MNKTSEIEWCRRFLIEKLPEPLTRASSHLQIFDSYVENTRLRLRRIRDPYTGAWTRSLQQMITAGDLESNVRKIAEIHLNDPEYAVLQRFEGREIRKNRYFHEIDRIVFTFDVYLGDLAGLTTARVCFENADEMESYEPPRFTIFEITNDPFFAGENLVGKHYEEVRAEVDKLGLQLPRSIEFADE
jgi:CYTH domain-containing protein